MLCTVISQVELALIRLKLRLLERSLEKKNVRQRFVQGEPDRFDPLDEEHQA